MQGYFTLHFEFNIILLPIQIYSKTMKAETNQRYVTDIEIKALAHIFGVTCDYLIEGTSHN